MALNVPITSTRSYNTHNNPFFDKVQKNAAIIGVDISTKEVHISRWDR